MVLTQEETNSLIAIVAIRVILIGLIKYNPSIKVEAQVKKKECLGAFYYSRSTVIVLYLYSKVALNKDLVRNSIKYLYKMLIKVK